VASINTIKYFHIISKYFHIISKKLLRVDFGHCGASGSRRGRLQALQNRTALLSARSVSGPKHAWKISPCRGGRPRFFRQSVLLQTWPPHSPGCGGHFGYLVPIGSKPSGASRLPRGRFRAFA